MDSRRKFIGAMASGLATTLAMPKGVLGANDRIRAGIIGIGDRGTEITQAKLQNLKYRRRSGWLPYAELAVGSYFVLMIFPTP